MTKQPTMTSVGWGESGSGQGFSGFPSADWRGRPHQPSTDVVEPGMDNATMVEMAKTKAPNCADAVRKRLAKQGISQSDVNDAVAWARSCDCTACCCCEL